MRINKYDALITTGALEAQFQNQKDILEKLLNEFTNLKNYISNDDFPNANICYGKIKEYINESRVNNDENMENLFDYVTQFSHIPKKDTSILDQNIDTLNLKYRIYNRLRWSGILTIGDLIEYSPKYLLKLRGIGKDSVDEIILALKDLNLSLHDIWDYYSINFLDLNESIQHQLELNNIKKIGELLEYSPEQLLRLQGIDYESLNSIINALEKHSLNLKNNILDSSIELLDLHKPIQMRLKHNNINSIGELIDKTPEEILRITGIYQKSLNHIVNALAVYNLHLA